MADEPKTETDGTVGKKQVFREIGSTGLRQTGGYITADFIPRLIGVQGAKMYHEMEMNDPLLSGVLFAMKSLVRNTDWRVELPKDAEKTAQAEERTKRLSKAIMQDLDTPWTEVVGEICSMFVYGFSPQEITWRKEDDGVWPASISLRKQDTVERWEFDKDNKRVTGLWQNDFIHPAVFIPIEKLLLTGTTTEGGNPEARSLLRGAVIPYLRKKVIEEAEGRVALRAAGIVKVQLPSEVLNGTDDVATQTRQGYLTMAANLATDKQGAVVLPSDRDDQGNLLYDVSFVTTESRRTIDMAPIIERINKLMASTVLADFILLGQQAVGSFALSSDKTSLFAQALGAYLRIIEASVTRQLFRRTWAINGWPMEECPELVAGDLESRDLAEFGAMLSSLQGAGMPLFPDPELEDWVRLQVGLPPRGKTAPDGSGPDETGAIDAATGKPKKPDPNDPKGGGVAKSLVDGDRTAEEIAARVDRLLEGQARRKADPDPDA